MVDPAIRFMKCISGKRMYQTLELAEEALIGAWSRYHYSPSSGPVAVYHCEDCGQYHFTSRGPMNNRLAELLKDGKIHQQREAQHWLNKLGNKR